MLDLRSSQEDSYASLRSMKAVETILSPVHVPGEPSGARYEWCINSAVVDTADEPDGTVYAINNATLYAIGR